MGKKRFIDKRKATTYSVVHRSQQDGQYTRRVEIQVLEAFRRYFLDKRREDTKRCRPVQF